MEPTVLIGIMFTGSTVILIPCCIGVTGYTLYKIYKYKNM